MADHFALLAGVGEVAIDLGILPWSTGEAMAAMKSCFEWWRRDKNGAVDFEIEKATEKLLSLARNGFYGKCDDDYPIRKLTSDGRDCFFIPRSYAVGEICKEYQYKSFVVNLKEKGLLALTKDGEIREQFWLGDNSNRPRGFAIIRKNLYDDPDTTEVHQSLGKKIDHEDKDMDDNIF